MYYLSYLKLAKLIMPLFQRTVVTKHLKSQNKEDLTAKWHIYKNHFHNPVIQEDIRSLKEEQYQGEFLEALFVKILGYTKPASSSETKFNLTTEYKNVKDSKKADGAIIVDEVVKAVIELKGTNTTDLSKIEVQAFGYKNNQPECTYVITSNFEKLRFYIDNAIDHIEFNLFTLSEKDFELLYLCLAFENIKNDTPKKIKKDSVSQEDAITKKLYNDYSLFKRELHQSLVLLNPQFDALTLFQKSQKLLDRFLFLFFAEDRQLLPPNSVRLILEQWTKLKDLDAYTPLFDRFKKYFGYLNTGYKGKQYDVYAYNGGLFKADAILDTIIIDDDLLYKHTLTLSEYDFDSEVDVNILGHIFENSLNELDEIKAQLEGQEIDKSKTKRKKDGVFYTPKYITKYIVENTVGKLCEEKKAELEIVEDDYNTDKKRQKKTIKGFIDKLTEYRNWLLQLTICDPACGSGAFLNQALDFLIKEHRYIDELQAKLFGDAMILSDVEKSILENNLFGVDLNDESVEIAKLSLWLRTAQPNRKLNDLNNNIKCGNSLIDDVAIAGDKAFNWQQEFPQIFSEKNKKAFHITTAVHDSRTSERMIKYKVREKRDLGTNPYPNIYYFTDEDDLIITQTIAQIVKEAKLNILAYNICSDHIHLLLVCEEADVSKIVKTIKGKTARIFNQHKEINPHSKGINSLVTEKETKSIPLWTQKFGCKEITTEDHLFTAIKYIETNRSKHHLPQLSRQINNIIDDFICDYNTAFKPEYTGGFDVVIGNPPYVRSRGLFDHKEKKYLIENYITSSYQLDLYKIFIEKACKIINNTGCISFITPSVFLTNDFDKPLRKYILDNFNLNTIVNSDNDIFSDASVKTVVFIITKLLSNYSDINFFKIINSEFVFEKSIDQHFFIKQDYLINEKINYNAFSIINKLNKNKKVNDFYEIKNGIKVRKELLYEYKIDENYKPFILGKNISPFFNSFDNIFIDYKIENEKLYTNQAFRNKKIFEQEKLITRQILGKRIVATLDEVNFFTDQTTYVINTKGTKQTLKYLLCILNSKLIFYYFINTSSDNKIVFPKVKRSQLLELPFIENINQQPFIEKADLMLLLNKELQELSQKFQRTLEREFFYKGLKPLANSPANPLPKKLQDWYVLSFAEFIKELENKKVKLSLSQKAEWEDYFLQESKKALVLKTQINTTDKDIDAMVYELYGLTVEEIKIVENS